MVTQSEPFIPILLGELPPMVNASTSISYIVGANLVMVKSPAVSSSIEALTPNGPAAVEVVPPGEIPRSELPQSTLSRLIDFRACIAEAPV